jgi:hypothetical protein
VVLDVQCYREVPRQPEGRERAQEPDQLSTGGMVTVIALNEIEIVVLQPQRCIFGSDLLRNELKLVELVVGTIMVLMAVSWRI